MNWKQENLLSAFPPRKGKMPRFLWPADKWRIVSGCWSREPESRVRLKTEGAAGQSESMAIIGPRDSNKIQLRVGFKFLTNTIIPPDGGAIVFFLAGNANSHLAFHYCIGKNNIQLFKKAHDVWTMLGAQSFEFQLNRDYMAEIRSHSGVHECLMQDGTHLRVDDHEISRGCIGIGGKLCDIEFNWLSFSAA